MRALGRTAAFAAVARRLLPPVDRAFAGRRTTVSTLGTGLPVCYLTVPGRRTGAPHTVPLLYAREGEVIVVAESNWGSRTRPAWAHNLEQAREATVTVRGIASRMRSRPAAPEEAERWWPMLLEIWPGWSGYRRRAGREIALYALEPLPPD